eukprot:TRINITY_DN2586_c0_g1_i1.p1 TRINITY_DN2586_c0_g1~~TRINITY_DN2586_c0_g1_i1.p1  ORF type:complete len:541 (-),score=189.14 TRINITY_DN2586_c0_g1_i1:344-1891(-)
MGSGGPPLGPESSPGPLIPPTPCGAMYFGPQMDFRSLSSYPQAAASLPQEESSEEGMEVLPSSKAVVLPPDDYIPVIQYLDMSTGLLQIQPLESACERLLMEGRLWDLENLCYVSSHYASPLDRQSLHLFTLKAYIAHVLPNRATELSNYLLKRGLDFPEFRALFNESFSPSAHTASLRPRRRGGEDTLPPLRHLKKLLLNPESLDEALEAFYLLESKTKFPSVLETSSLIENLVKADRVEDAALIAEKMLARKTYPLPKIFRFLLNKLAMSGAISPMVSIGQRLSSKVKKEVSFDNRLCNAYLAAGKGEDFLDRLQEELDRAGTDEGALEAVRDKFPRGGAMGLLESEPNLLGKYKKLAEGYVSSGYVAPMNVLWTYFFIMGHYEEAQSIWESYLAPSSQIMFQKVCQTARSKSDVELASRLVELLVHAKVSPRAQGIAYSCLLDVYSQREEFSMGLNTLNASLDSGVRLEDINRTALLRLKIGLEKMGLGVPFSVPKKSSSLAGEYEEQEEEA